MAVQYFIFRASTPYPEPKPRSNCTPSPRRHACEPPSPFLQDHGVVARHNKFGAFQVKIEQTETQTKTQTKTQTQTETQTKTQTESVPKVVPNVIDTVSKSEQACLSIYLWS